MRINIYSEELTKNITVLTRTADNTNKTYVGVRFHLQSPEELHKTPEDDDTSAVTFWIDEPGAKYLRELFMEAQHHLGAFLEASKRVARE